MRALRIEGPLQVELVEASKPVPPSGDVLIRVAFAGVCATDRKLALRGPSTPRVPGHEFAGWLEDGSDVGIHPDIGCGTCPHCRSGFENRCARRVSIGLDRNGGMAEWVSVPEGQVLPLDGLLLEIGALLEPLACCLHATAFLGVEEGMPAMVVGAGPMGILAMWALKSAGARVAVSEVSEPRRRVVADLGTEAVLGPDEDVVAALGEAPRAAIVTAPGQEPLRWALERLQVGGRLHAFAGSPGSVEVDANLIHYRHLTLVGSTGSTMRDYRRAAALVRSGAVPLDRLPRTLVTLEEAVASLRSADAPPDRRSVIDMGRSSTG
jgi:L-iditol 2-dehydrogenase